MQNFKDTLGDIDSRCAAAFGAEFRASYIGGSFAYGSPIPFESDLDYWLFLRDPLSPEREREIDRLTSELESRFPFINGIHLNATSVDEFAEIPFNGFILKHNCEHLRGEDIVSVLEDSYGIQDTGRDLSKRRLLFARRCKQQLSDGEKPDNLGSAPPENNYGLRKIAQMFVVVESAYYLMATGQFTTFRPPAVLSTMKRRFPQYERYLRTTQQLLDNPEAAQVERSSYLDFVDALLEELFERIDQ